MSFLILSKFKRINKRLLTLKSSENQGFSDDLWFSDDFTGNRSWVIRLTLSVLIPEEKKLTSIFVFTFFCGASKGFMKTLKT